jgi:hypothetical protein
MPFSIQTLTDDAVRHQPESARLNHGLQEAIDGLNNLAHASKLSSFGESSRPLGVAPDRKVNVPLVRLLNDPESEPLRKALAIRTLSALRRPDRHRLRVRVPPEQVPRVKLFDLADEPAPEGFGHWLILSSFVCDGRLTAVTVDLLGEWDRYLKRHFVVPEAIKAGIHCDRTEIARIMERIFCGVPERTRKLFTSRGPAIVVASLSKRPEDWPENSSLQMCGAVAVQGARPFHVQLDRSRGKAQLGTACQAGCRDGLMEFRRNVTTKHHRAAMEGAPNVRWVQIDTETPWEVALQTVRNHAAAISDSRPPRPDLSVSSFREKDLSGTT